MARFWAKAPACSSMEELEHAHARGARILAEVKGFGMASNEKDMINPGPSRGRRWAMRQAAKGQRDSLP